MIAPLHSDHREPLPPSSMLDARIDIGVLPERIALSQGLKSRFNPVTRIHIDLPQSFDWTHDVYDLAGRRVKHWSGLEVGIVPVEWDAANAPSGVYFYRPTAGNFTISRKMVLLK